MLSEKALSFRALTPAGCDLRDPGGGANRRFAGRRAGRDQAKYEGYIERQREEVERHSKLERLACPPKSITAQCAVCRPKYSKAQLAPAADGRSASRISGITPAAISLLLVHLKRGFQPHKKTA